VTQNTPKSQFLVLHVAYLPYIAKISVGVKKYKTSRTFCQFFGLFSDILFPEGSFENCPKLGHRTLPHG
jgi:hypothetical protein